jgi:C4-dicarboxylate transporter DctQ subunit
MKTISMVSQVIESVLIPVSNFLLISIVAMIFVDVIARYFFGLTFGFLEDFSTLSQLWYIFILAGVVTKARKHIAVDMLPGRLSKRKKKAWLIYADIMTLIFAIVICWSGVEVVQNLREIGATSSTAITVPEWIVRLCIPIGAAFIAFFGIERLAKDIASFRQRGSYEA